MEVQGFANGRFGLVRECFAGILATQPGTGAAFAAWCGDRHHVDLLSRADGTLRSPPSSQRRAVQKEEEISKCRRR